MSSRILMDLVALHLPPVSDLVGRSTAPHQCPLRKMQLCATFSPFFLTTVFANSNIY